MSALTKYIDSTTYKNTLLKYLHVSQYSFQHKSPISIQSERVESITFSTLTAQMRHICFSSRESTSAMMTRQQITRIVSVRSNRVESTTFLTHPA